MLILAISIANTVSISLKLKISNFERKKVTIIKVQHFSDKQNEILLFGNVNRGNKISLAIWTRVQGKPCIVCT